MYIQGVSDTEANPFFIQFHGDCAQIVPAKVKSFIKFR
jgi:hypothetical protein